MPNLRLAVSNPPPPPLRRDTYNCSIYLGDARYDVHYAVPRGMQWPTNASPWFGVYDRAAARWYFELAALPAAVAVQVREVLAEAVFA